MLTGGERVETNILDQHLGRDRCGGRV